MRCMGIMASMEQVAAACAAGSCADCVAAGYCIALKREQGITLAELAQDFEMYFYGAERVNAPGAQEVAPGWLF